MMQNLERERGQALFETAIFLPVFLLCLFAIIWAAQTSTLSERIQIGIRQGGFVSQNTQPYQAYSLYAMYATLDGLPPLSQTNCSIADVTNLTSSRASFFKPQSVDGNACSGATSTLTTGFDNTVILQDDYILLKSSAPTPNFLLSHGISNLNSSLTATENFFRSPNLETLSCVTGVGAVIKADLEGAYDMSAASLVLPSAFPINPVVGNIPVQPCVTFSPQPTPLPADTPVASSAPYTAPPGLVTPSPYVALPTPVGQATATPGYTPVPGSSPGNVS